MVFDVDQAQELRNRALASSSAYHGQVSVIHREIVYVKGDAFLKGPWLAIVLHDA